MLLGGRSPDFRRVCGSQDFLLAAPSRSLSSGLSPLSFRLQWRGPCCIGVNLRPKTSENSGFAALSQRLFPRKNDIF